MDIKDEIETTRVCKKCGSEKPMQEFPINNTFFHQATGEVRIIRKHTCNSCRYEQSKDRARLLKEHEKPSEAECPICLRTTDKLVLDHDHDTGEFRGWLCNDCNSAVGKLNDDVGTLERAIKYLKRL